MMKLLEKSPLLAASILTFVLGALACVVNLFIAKTSPTLSRVFIASMLVSVIFAGAELWEHFRRKESEK